MEQYEILQCLKKINDREVLLAKEKATGKRVVIKKDQLRRKKDEEETNKEIRILRTLQHRHIVSYISSFEDEATMTINIVMPYCLEGDLNGWIQKHRKDRTSFRTEDIIMILRQLCDALAYIHKQHILHRDIKPQNIFVENSWTVKLGDFGISKILESTLQDAETNNVGTFPYIAPEVFDKKYREKCDMWSLGCVLYEMITLKRPFQALVWNDLRSEICNDPYPPLSEHVDRNLADLVAELLRKNPDERPNAEQILARQFVHQQPPTVFVPGVEFLELISKLERLESKFASELNKTKSEMFEFIEKEAHLIKSPADDKQEEYSFDFYIENFRGLENSGKDMYSMPVYVTSIKSSVKGYVEFNRNGEMIVWLKFARYPRKVMLDPARANHLKIKATVVDINRKKLPEIDISNEVLPQSKSGYKDVNWDESLITGNEDFGFEIGKVQCKKVLDKGYGQEKGRNRGAILVRFYIDARQITTSD